MAYAAPLKGAIRCAGIPLPQTDVVFTQRRKDGTRRIKLWFGELVYTASPRKLRELRRQLKIAFPNFLSMHFITGPRGCGHSFCVIIDDLQPIKL